MASKVVRGVLLDVDYVDNGKSSQIRLFVKTAKGIDVFSDRAFHPYFYAETYGKGAAKKIEKQVTNRVKCVECVRHLTVRASVTVCHSLC